MLLDIQDVAVNRYSLFPNRTLRHPEAKRCSRQSYPNPHNPSGRESMPLTYARFSSHWLQILKYEFKLFSVVFKGLIKWLFVICICFLHFFFLFKFSLLLTSLVKEEKKRIKPFQSLMQPGKEKKSKISTSILQKQEGVLGVIKHMLDNWYYPLARYCSYHHSLKLHEWSLRLSIHTCLQRPVGSGNYFLGLLQIPHLQPIHHAESPL